LVVAAESTITRSNCEARLTAALSAGLEVASCPFLGLMRNTGQGCAGNVRGETTIYRDSAGQQPISAGAWSYPDVIRPNEQVTYNGDAIGVPTSGQWFWRSSVNWDNVPC
jgi:hypothetical protein